MGSGKSTVGKIISDELFLNFFDTVDEIEARTGASIDWIFDLEGEDGFRKRESEMLDEMVKKNSIVLSTGGGIVLSKSNRELLSDLVFYIRKFKPEIVFTHDPFRMNSFLHRDHRNLGFSVMDAIYPYARDHLHFPDQITKDITPFKVKKLLFWGSDNPNVIVNVSNFEKRKIDALSMHQSQLPGLSLGSEYGNGILERLKSSANNFDFEFGESFRMIEARS